MKVPNSLFCGVAIMSLAAVGVAQAGPQVKITFKNNGSSDAIYDVRGSSAYSYAEANPKPEPRVSMGESSVFYVRGAQSADVTTVVFQYRMGAKTCKFKTSYLKLPSRGGTLPKWGKSAEPGGGARCDVRVTSADMSSHDWTVEFTMR
jgi:hypothetical protein